MDDRRDLNKQYQRKWRSASRKLKSLGACKNIPCDVDSSDNESSSVRDEFEVTQNRGIVVHNTINSSSVTVGSDLEEPMNLSSDVDRSAKSDDILSLDDVPLVSYLLDSSSESESDEDQLSDNELKQCLASWVNECGISHSAVNKLLPLLQRAGHKLPSTATTLLKTIKEIPVTIKSSMDYVYLNVDTQLENFYNALPIDKKNHLTELDISLNIDGLPLFKSSRTSLWPVLCAVKNVTPVQVFPLVLACGLAKPADLDFLKDVIADLKKLLTNGLPIENKILKVNLSCIVCDAPARAMVKACKLYSGYDGCDKCVQHGKWCGRITYPEIECELRTDENFRNQLYSNHHKGISPFCELPIDMVNMFPIDYMHQCCIGVMKKLLLTWMRGDLKVRLSSTQVCALNKRILAVKAFIQIYFHACLVLWMRLIGGKPLS